MPHTNPQLCALSQQHCCRYYHHRSRYCYSCLFKLCCLVETTCRFNRQGSQFPVLSQHQSQLPPFRVHLPLQPFSSDSQFVEHAAKLQTNSHASRPTTHAMQQPTCLAASCCAVWNALVPSLLDPARLQKTNSKLFRPHQDFWDGADAAEKHCTSAADQRGTSVGLSQHANELRFPAAASCNSQQTTGAVVLLVTGEPQLCRLQSGASSELPQHLGLLMLVSGH